MTDDYPGPVPASWCEHGPGGHQAGAPAAATAPAGARAWLLIESGGPWAAEPADSPLPLPMAKLALSAEELGIRLQLIRRPARPGRSGSSRREDATGRGDGAAPAVFACWTAGAAPWLRRMSTAGLGPAALAALAAGRAPGGAPESRPLFLVCTHGKRDRCCARVGVPLARELARHADGVWETTHVGGHRYAANLVILPHGLYYGPVDTSAARAAISAYQRGEITARGYRGRAGQPTDRQQEEHAAVARSGTLGLPCAGSCWKRP